MKIQAIRKMALVPFFLFTVFIATADITDWRGKHLTLQPVPHSSFWIHANGEGQYYAGMLSGDPLLSARHPGTALVRAAGALVLEPIMLFQAQAGEGLVAAFYRLFGEKNMESGKTYTAGDEKDNRFEFEAYPTLDPKRLILTRYESEGASYSERFIKLGSSGRFGSEGDIYEGPDGKRYVRDSDTNNVTEEHAKLFESCLKVILNETAKAAPR